MRKLRRNFILAAMASLFIVLGSVIAGMNILNYCDMIDDADKVAVMIAENDGVFPHGNIEKHSSLNDDGKKPPDGSPPPKPDDKVKDLRESEATATPPSAKDREDTNRYQDSISEMPDATHMTDRVGSDIRTGEQKNRGDDPVVAPVRELGPMDMSREAAYETRYFSVLYDKNDDVITTHMDAIAAVSEDDALAYSKKLLAEAKDKKKKTGFFGDYRYLVYTYDTGVVSTSSDDMRSAKTSSSPDESDGKNMGGTDTTDMGHVVVFIDSQANILSYETSLRMSIIVSVIGLFVVFMLVFFTSKLVFKPVEESERKQKQFLTDASHELKTPLAIIKANTEVMELDVGENKWTLSTHKQIERLSDMVSQLISLTRLDEDDTGEQIACISLCDIVMEQIAEYRTQAELLKKSIIANVDKDIYVGMNKKNLEQLISILLDNAVKYALPHTDIVISVKKRNRRAILSTYNKCEGINKGDNNVLFERFYRADASRNSQTGGSGIGLSVAKAIVEKARGKISAYSDDGESLTIEVILLETGGRKTMQKTRKHS